MKMTKKIVDLLIGANVKNRRVSKNRIEALARSMKNGTFIPDNGQTIVVNASYTRLLDGQHRLYAIRMAGTYDFDIPVVEVPDSKADSVFDTIDVVQGQRSLSQILALDGDIPHAARVAQLITCFVKSVSGKVNLNPSEVRSYYYKFKDTIDSIAVWKRCVVGGILPRVPIQAGVLNSCLLYHTSPAMVIAAYHRVLGNSCETSAENALLNLIVQSDGGVARAKDLFVKTTKALYGGSKLLKIAHNEDVGRFLAKSFVED